MRIRGVRGWSGHLPALPMRTDDSLTPVGFHEKAKILLRFERLLWGSGDEVIGLHILIGASESNKSAVSGVMRACGSSYAYRCALSENPESQGFARTVSGMEKTISENLDESSKKVFTGQHWGPITRLHRRGAALANAATRTGWLRASVHKFFDIVDKQEGMRGQRYGV